jgi:ferredoxin-thioredoxin reductase catalytic chain
MEEPSEKSMERISRLVTSFTKKTGTTTHPNKEISEAVQKGLAFHIDQLKKPLCPCRFYPDKQAEAKRKTWVCPCSDMQIYKYCHCLLFVTQEGLPITEHLPQDHEGRQIYGEVKDPAPELGRALRKKAGGREKERKQRPS